MIDFHTHVLPGIDDGSADLTMSAGMIREEYSQGTRVIVATPHFYADRMSIDRFLARRDEAFEQVEAWRREESALADTAAGGMEIPQILTGAEVYYFQGMGRANALPDLCVSGTDTILLEMPFAQWDKGVLRDVEDILNRQKLTIVLAHIERYIEFQKDKSVWEEIFDLPVIPQINAGSFQKRGGLFRRDHRRKFCLHFLEEHPRLILGSDAHNLTSRPPNLKAGREEIASALGEDALHRIDETTREVLGL